MSMNGTTPTHSTLSFLSTHLGAKGEAMAKLGTSEIWTDRHVQAPLKALDLTFALGCFTLKSLGLTLLTPLRFFTEGPSKACIQSVSLLQKSCLAVIQIAAVVTTLVIGILMPKTLYHLFKSESLSNTSPPPSPQQPQDSMTPDEMPTPTPTPLKKSLSYVDEDYDPLQAIKNQINFLNSTLDQKSQELESQKQELEASKKAIETVTKENEGLKIKQDSLTYKLEQSKGNIQLQVFENFLIAAKKSLQEMNAFKVSPEHQFLEPVINNIKIILQKSFQSQNEIIKIGDLIKQIQTCDQDNIPQVNYTQLSTNSAKIIQNCFTLKTNLLETTYKLDELHKQTNDIRKSSDKLNKNYQKQLDQRKAEHNESEEKLSQLITNLRSIFKNSIIKQALENSELSDEVKKNIKNTQDSIQPPPSKRRTSNK